MCQLQRNVLFNFIQKLGVQLDQMVSSVSSFERKVVSSLDFDLGLSSLEIKWDFTAILKKKKTFVGKTFLSLRSFVGDFFLFGLQFLRTFLYIHPSRINNKFFVCTYTKIRGKEWNNNTTQLYISFEEKELLLFISRILKR